jgi:cytochrome c
MKKVKFSVLALSMLFGTTLLTSCGGSEEQKETTTETVTEEVVAEAPVAKDGAELYKTSGCVACHQVDKKLVGPSILDIAGAYADEATLTAFLKGESKAIVDPAQEAVMAPQLEITKKMSAEDLQVIVSYIMSYKK